ncbi:MAG: polysaccharide deacetylase family protein [Clostridia bacterium]|nr:polysaccharide deacetylase family protein [Clostridia bacterium]
MEKNLSHRCKQILTLLVLTGFVLSTLTLNPQPVRANSYSDLAGHWAEEKVAYLNHKGVTIDTDKDFKPEEKITRAAFVDMLVKALNLPRPAAINQVSEAVYNVAETVYQDSYRFIDVPQDHWAWSVVEAAYQGGVVRGGPEGRFNPEAPLQRAEAAVLLHRAGVSLGTALWGVDTYLNKALLPYQDYREVPEWAVPATVALGEKGVIKGFKDGSFRPRSSLTQAEAAAVIYAFLDELSQTHEYYGQIEAIDIEGSKINVQIAGVQLKLGIHQKVKVFRQGQSFPWWQIKPGEAVKLILNQNGEVIFISLEAGSYVEKAVYGDEMTKGFIFSTLPKKLKLGVPTLIPLRVNKNQQLDPYSGPLRVNGHVYRAEQGLVKVPIIPMGEELNLLVEVTEEGSRQVFRLPVTQEVKVPMLMYHHLALPGQYSNNNSVVTPEQFEAQMKALQEAGYTSVTLGQLRAYIAAEQPLPKRPVVITFDDGYESNYVYAYPILQKYGHKATINIVVKSTLEDVAKSVYGTVYTGFEPRQQTHLTWTQMKEIVDSGLVEIQSHTFDSHNLIDVDAQGKKGKPLVSYAYLADKKRLETPEEYRARIYADLARAKKEIETNLGVKVNALAYPYGSYNQVVEEVAKELGHDTGITIEHGYNQQGVNPMTLKRINVNPTDSLEVFLHRLVGK